MRKMRCILFVIASVFISLTAANPQSKFEGKIVIEQKDNGVTTILNYYVKGEKIRLDVNSKEGEGDVIFDKKNKKMLIVMPSMKTYMEFPMDMGTWNDLSEEEAGIDFKKTGITKIINGYKCEEWTRKGGSETAWMTKGLGSFFFFESSMSTKSKSKFLQQILGSGYFPMIVTEKDSTGNLTNSFEVKSVEKKSLDDSFFTVPSGYKVMKMQAGGGKQ